MNKTVRNIIIRVSMLIGLGVFIFLLIVAKNTRNTTRIEKLNIEINDWNGNFFINKDQVKSVINNRFDIIGKTLSGEDLRKIENSLSILPQSSLASAYTDNNGNLNIKIEQRIPLFRVYNMQGQSYYVDENKIKFSTSGNYTARVPIVTGKIMEKLDTLQQPIKSAVLNKLYNTVQTVQENKLWNALIGQYNINEKLEIEMIPRMGTATIIIGDDKNIEQKLKQLEVFYFDVLQKVGWNYYKVINIMYKNQVVCLK